MLIFSQLLQPLSGFSPQACAFLPWHDTLPSSPPNWQKHTYSSFRILSILDCSGCCKRSDKTWFAGERNGKPLQHSCLENPMNIMKRQKDRPLKDEPPRSVGAQYATAEEGRNRYRKNEEMEPNRKQCAVVEMEVKSNAVRTILHGNREC